MTTPRWGVYCLANDLVLEWALALFESLREFAPGLPLMVVPYDERQDALGRRLAVKRRALYRHPSDAGGERIHPLGRQFLSVPGASGAPGASPM